MENCDTAEFCFHGKIVELEDPTSMSPINMETNAIPTAKAIVELMADLLFI